MMEKEIEKDNQSKQLKQKHRKISEVKQEY